MMGAVYALGVLVLLVYVLVSVVLPALSGWPEEPYRTDVEWALWYATEEETDGDSL